MFSKRSYTSYGRPHEAIALESRQRGNFNAVVQDSVLILTFMYTEGTKSQKCVWRAGGAVYPRIYVNNSVLGVKGTVSQDFRLQTFFMFSFPPAPEYPITTVSNFSKIRGDIRSLRCTTVVVDTSGKSKKSSIRKFFNFFLKHLWVVESSWVSNISANFRKNSKWP